MDTSYLIFHLFLYFSLLYSFKIPFKVNKYVIDKKQELEKTYINGFYGLIGPNVNITEMKTLYEFFSGDGIIQGVFIEKGKITPICHKIETEKYMYEVKNKMKFSRDFFMIPFYMVLHGIGIIPNILGLSNTAILRVQSRIFTLFERDFPYEVKIDIQNKQIHTIGKQYIQNLKHFSGHSKYDEYNKLIHTIDYNVGSKKIQYSVLNENFEHVFRENIRCKHFPVIHDFGLYDNKSIFIDSPLCLKLTNIFIKKNPFVLNENSNTYIYIYDSKIHKLSTYIFKDKGFYIFHYADITENEKQIEILAPIYDKLDFSSLDIEGKYRKIIVNKKTGNVVIHKNGFLESMNLDFPIKWDDKIILRNVHERSINGFVICNELDILNKIFYNNISFCGEPQLVRSKTSDYLISLGYKNENMNDGYLFLIDLNNPENLLSYELNVPVNIGFHSIFLKNDKIDI